MKIYKVSANIDGFGGLMPDKYFYSFEDAIKQLDGTPGIHYYSETNEWDIEGVKSVDVNINDDGEIYIRGIPFPDNEKDEWCIRWASASIKPIEIDGIPNDDRLYILAFRYGYKSYLNHCIDGDIDYNTEPMYLRYNILAKSFSKNYMKKLARNNYKHLARSWNTHEYERRCDPIHGGEDFISLLEFKIA